MSPFERPSRVLEVLHTWTYRSWMAYIAMAVFFLVFNVGAMLLVLKTEKNTTNASIAKGAAAAIQKQRVRNTYQACVEDKVRNRAIVRFLVSNMPNAKQKPLVVFEFADAISPFHPSCVNYTKQKTGDSPVQ